MRVRSAAPSPSPPRPPRPGTVCHATRLGPLFRYGRVALNSSRPRKLCQCGRLEQAAHPAAERFPLFVKPAGRFLLAFAQTERTPFGGNRAFHRVNDLSQRDPFRRATEFELASRPAKGAHPAGRGQLPENFGQVRPRESGGSGRLAHGESLSARLLRKEERRANGKCRSATAEAHGVFAECTTCSSIISLASLLAPSVSICRWKALPARRSLSSGTGQ